MTRNDFIEMFEKIALDATYRKNGKQLILILEDVEYDANGNEIERDFVNAKLVDEILKMIRDTAKSVCLRRFITYHFDDFNINLRHRSRV